MSIVNNIVITVSLITQSVSMDPKDSVHNYGTDLYMSRHMGKPTICLGENKGANQLLSTAKLISAFVFATRIVQFLIYLNLKFQASSSFL